ncbi:MAG: glycosyltransferase [Acetivibrionales bacterium]
MDKPKVYVLLATYNPNLCWLKEQLYSINNQTYKNIEVIVCDDGSDSISNDELNTLLKQQITKFPYIFISNHINQGPNKTFERLTLEAAKKTRDINGKAYFAYCDQDDIWESEKIEILINDIIQKDAVLAYSDMSVIDSEGRLVADSITKVRKRFYYFEGHELWQKILVRNFISGCCMIVRSDIAIAAIPFEKDMQHDRWISVIASTHGYIAYENKALVRYRQHGRNVTGVLKDITDKASYIQIRIKDHLRILQNINARNDVNDELAKFLSEYIDQMKIRLKYAGGEYQNLFKMLSYIKFNRATIVFEVVAMVLPEKVFKRALNIIKAKNL